MDLDKEIRDRLATLTPEQKAEALAVLRASSVPRAPSAGQWDAPTGRKKSVRSLGPALEEQEKSAIVQALEATKGNKTEAAEALGLLVRTLDRRIERYGLKGFVDDLRRQYGVAGGFVGASDPRRYANRH